MDPQFDLQRRLLVVRLVFGAPAFFTHVFVDLCFVVQSVVVVVVQLYIYEVARLLYSRFLFLLVQFLFLPLTFIARSFDIRHRYRHFKCALLRNAVLVGRLFADYVRIPDLVLR